MEPQPTPVRAPLQIRIADDLRMKIERGELRPGDVLPSAHELAKQWNCSPGSGRSAIDLLKRQGLATTTQGSRPIVRIPPRASLLRQDIAQVEKDRVLLPEDERRANGAAEDNMRMPLSELDFRVRYQRIPAPEALAEVFGIESGTELLRREYESVDRATDRLEQWSVSYLVVSLIESNPDLMDASKEPWPGGTQHQLYTVGIELGRMETEVTAAMPTTVESQVWDIPEGVPMLLGRRVAYDTTGRVVEVSEARYPADRTTMSFSLTLKPWEAK